MLDPNPRFDRAIDRILFLRTILPFETMEAEELAVLGEYTRERVFRRGEVLLREGERVEHIYLVVEGLVRLSRSGRLAGDFGPRQAIGALALLAGGRSYDEGVVALRKTRVLELNRDALLDVFEDNFVILHHALQALASFVIDQNESVKMNAGWSSDKAPVFDEPAHGLDLVQRIMVLHNTGPFRQTSLGGLAGLARRLTEVAFAPGQELFHAGDRADAMWRLLRGTVGLHRGQEVVGEVGPRDIVGALEAVAGRQHGLTATARTPVVALQASNEDLLDVFEDHSEMGVDFLEMLSRQALDVLEAKTNGSEQEIG